MKSYRKLTTIVSQATLYSIQYLWCKYPCYKIYCWNTNLFRNFWCCCLFIFVCWFHWSRRIILHGWISLKKKSLKPLVSFLYRAFESL